MVLRPGNAGARSSEDHILVFHTAVAQLPESFFTDTGILAVGNKEASGPAPAGFKPLEFAVQQGAPGRGGARQEHPDPAVLHPARGARILARDSG